MEKFQNYISLLNNNSLDSTEPTSNASSNGERISVNSSIHNAQSLHQDLLQSLQIQLQTSEAEKRQLKLNQEQEELQFQFQQLENSKKAHVLRPFHVQECIYQLSPLGTQTTSNSHLPQTSNTSSTNSSSSSTKTPHINKVVLLRIIVQILRQMDFGTGQEISQEIIQKHPNMKNYERKLIYTVNGILSSKKNSHLFEKQETFKLNKTRKTAWRLKGSTNNSISSFLEDFDNSIESASPSSPFVSINCTL